MTEPQVWVLIGVFAAAFFGLIGIVTTNFNRTMDARFDAVRTDINAKFDITNMKLENMVAIFKRSRVRCSAPTRGSAPSGSVGS